MTAYETTRDARRDEPLRVRCRDLIALYPADPKLVIRRRVAVEAGLHALIRHALPDAHGESKMVEVNARLALAALEAAP